LRPFVRAPHRRSEWAGDLVTLFRRMEFAHVAEFTPEYLQRSDGKRT